MLFGKKKKEIKCESCGKAIEDTGKFSFCPFCGNPLMDKESEFEDYGLLGKNDSDDTDSFSLASMGITDKLINSIMRSMMKSFNSQLKNPPKDAKTEIATLPNGIKIRVSSIPLNQLAQKKPRKAQPILPKLTEEQIERMSKLPRITAKSSSKRLPDKVIYELATPGVKDIKDVLVSKLETGYEIKAIGDKKVF